MATLWSHSQRDSAQCMVSLWNQTSSDVCFHSCSEQLLHCSEMVNTVRSAAWFLVQMQMSYSCWGVALQQLLFPALKPHGVMAKHKSSLCMGPLAQPVIGPLIKPSSKAAVPQTTVKAFGHMRPKTWVLMGSKTCQCSVSLQSESKPCDYPSPYLLLMTGRRNLTCKKKKKHPVGLIF